MQPGQQPLLLWPRQAAAATLPARGIRPGESGPGMAVRQEHGILSPGAAGLIMRVIVHRPFPGLRSVVVFISAACGAPDFPPVVSAGCLSLAVASRRSILYPLRSKPSFL